MSNIEDSTELFEARKADHIRLALDERTQAKGGGGFERVHLVHEAFPDLDFSEISLEVPLLTRLASSPFFVSSMTAGHGGSFDLNLIMARVSEQRGWAMGVGSQRRQLTDRSADHEWKEIRRACPRVRFFGNIGIAQLIVTSVADVRRLADSLEAEAMIVHANPLQECLQPEGTPQFAGGLAALERLVSQLGLPVIVKETGCGFSESTLRKLCGIGLAVVDIAGFGGTHWGRIEGGRSEPGGRLHRAAETFRDWGIPTVDSLLAATSVGADYEVWASGGVRSGLDAAKLLAMGARMVGLAKPVIEAALQGEEALDRVMGQFEFELKTALFCTGSRSVQDMRDKKVWRWSKT